jgi:hypothetical protein
MLRPEAPCLILSALVVEPSPQCKVDPVGFQASAEGAASPKRTHFSLVPSRRKSGTPRSPLLTTIMVTSKGGWPRSSWA